MLQFVSKLLGAAALLALVPYVALTQPQTSGVGTPPSDLVTLGDGATVQFDELGEQAAQLAAASLPRRLAGSRNAVVIRAAIASRNVRSGMSEPGNGSGMSNPSVWRRGMR